MVSLPPVPPTIGLVFSKQEKFSYLDSDISISIANNTEDRISALKNSQKTNKSYSSLGFLKHICEKHIVNSKIIYQHKMKILLLISKLTSKPPVLGWLQYIFKVALYSAYGLPLSVCTIGADDAYLKVLQVRL